MNHMTQYQNAPLSEYLAGIDNQIPEPVSCRQKLSDNHPHQTQSDIDLHIADDCRDGTRQHDLCQGMKTVAS